MNELIHYWCSGGPLLIPIAGTSFGIWLCFARSRETLKRTLKEGRQVAAELQCDRSFPSPTALAAFLQPLQGGIAAMLRGAVCDIEAGALPMNAFALRETECREWLRRDFILLAAFTAIAPLLGLLGTVMGMVETFDAASAISGETGTRVAGGISQALITTQFGLVVALPGVFGLARLQRMLRNTEVLMARCRTHLLDALREKKEAA